MSQYSKWDLGGCGCVATPDLTIRGCNSIPYPGLTVQIYDHAGGTLLFSGTTNGSGQVASGLPAGNYHVVITGQSRFNAYAQTTTLGTTVTLVVATGYHCFPGCLIPLADTIHATSTVWHFGLGQIATCTLTYSGGAGGWLSIQCLGCGTPGFCTNAQSLLSQATGAFSVFYPAPGGTTHIYTPGALTCPTSFNAVFSLPNWGPCAGATDTWTFTE